MKTLMLLSIIFLFQLSNCFSQSPEYTKKISEFLKVSGGLETIESSVNSIFLSYQTEYTNIPEEFWIKLKKEKTQEFLDSFVDHIAPVYHKYFTMEEIDYVIKFYKSEIGKKYASLTIKLMEEGANVGENWGNFIAQEINSAIENSNYNE